VQAFILGIVLAQAAPGALTLSASKLSLNPAQQQVITIGGAAAPVQATLDQRLVSVSVSADGTSVTVTATQATGEDVLHLVDANGARADLPIRVAFNAGTIVPQTSLTVTGNPAQPAWLAARVQTAVARLTQTMPGAQKSIGPVGEPAAPLQPGESTQFTVPVQIAGNGEYFDQSGTTTVSVQNLAVGSFAPGVLFYDDDPEHVGQDGVLFRGTVSATTPTRLFFYHDAVADPGNARKLVVTVSSDSQDPTSVQLVDAVAGPNMDVMYVGQTLTKNFLATKSLGEGVVVTLSQDEPYVMSDLSMNARELVSGSVDLRVLSGGPVVVTVLAVSPGVDVRSLLAGPVLPGDGHHRTGVFTIAGFGTDALSYSAGGPDATVVLGDTEPTPPSVDAAASGHDYGDYGVLHTIDLAMSNSGSAPSTAYLYLKPLGGPARGSFLIGGNLFDVGCVRVPAPYEVTSFDLAAGATSRVVVQTMTDGGSFYPVQIGLTATPPQPSAPPIGAPDGCFPKPPSSSASR
jgi:hypothetical protein